MSHIYARTRTEPIGIVIVDDHGPYREALGAVLAAHPDLAVLATAGDGLRGLILIDDLKPDIALVDVKMQPLDGFAVCRGVVDAQPDRSTRVVLMSADRDDALLARGRDCGAAGYLGKNAPNEALRRCVLAVAGGATWFA